MLPSRADESHLRNVEAALSAPPPLDRRLLFERDRPALDASLVAPAVSGGVPGSRYRSSISPKPGPATKLPRRVISCPEITETSPPSRAASMLATPDAVTAHPSSVIDPPEVSPTPPLASTSAVTLSVCPDRISTVPPLVTVEPLASIGAETVRSPPEIELTKPPPPDLADGMRVEAS